MDTLSATGTPHAHLENAADLARRLRRTARWYHPAIALVCALTVWAPATGSVFGFTMVTAYAAILGCAAEALRVRQLGTKLRRPTGTRGWIALMSGTGWPPPPTPRRNDHPVISG
ncbi:hypothetical protein [Mycetocola saprophilus]|uniref:hypothetical protein n=1 Tax=Mycetocola saprophilus TaxID=76636 RepID=UPI003BF40FF9